MTRSDGTVEEVGSQSNSISVYRLPGKPDYRYIGCVTNIYSASGLTEGSDYYDGNGFSQYGYIDRNIDACQAEAYARNFKYFIAADYGAGCWLTNEDLPF